MAIRVARASCFVACAALALCGCPTSAPQAPAAELPAPSSAPAGDTLKRLTITQYRNTLRDLSAWALGRELDPALDAQVIAALALLDQAPPDRRAHGGYRRLDQALDQRHVDVALRVGVALGDALSAPAQLERIAGPCATDLDPENDAACLVAFIERFGARALRRPLERQDVAFYASLGAYADVITVLLNAPELLYFVEHGQDEAAERPGTYRLSAFELASRLSYQFWQTMPDDALWQAAQDGSLRRPDVLEAQVDRLLADPRARATLHELFTDWLALDDIPMLEPPELRQHMIDEVLAMLDHYTWDEPAGVAALLTSERSFARTDDLASVYGIEPWDGSAQPPLLPPGQRPGLLTRAAFLATGTEGTRPIKKGVLVRTRLLCDALPPPPANVNAKPPALRDDMTTRQVVEQLTEQPGTACAGCHATQINPLGFAFEGFDGYGRARASEHGLAVDTRSVPRVTPDDERASTGPGDLMQLMLDSGKVEACVARQYARFTLGRMEDPARDAALLERLRASLVQTGQLRAMLRAIALAPELAERAFGEATP